MDQNTISKHFFLTLNFKLIIKLCLLINSFRKTGLNLTLNNLVIEETHFKYKIMKLR